MRTTTSILAVLLVAMTLAQAALLKNFPANWGKPPEIQTHDYVELPDGYGHGSSSLAKWIAANIEKEKSAAAPVAPAVVPPLYENSFEKAEVGQLPDEFLTLDGEFTVKEDGTNKFLELPGAPLDSFAVLFGPTTNSDVCVTARILGTARGRLYPAFGVGLCGVSGYRLQVSPAKRALEIYKDADLKTTVPYEWQTGVWTRMKFQVRTVSDGQWLVQGKAWAAANTEPDGWLVEFKATDTPIAGRASVTGSPFSGKQILFDDLIVERVIK